MPRAGGWYDQPVLFVKAHGLFKEGPRLYREQGKNTNATIHRLIREAQASKAEEQS